MRAQPYYQALCLQKLGKSDEAAATLRRLLESGQQVLSASGSAGAVRPRTELAHGHYLAGLGYLGMNDRAKATSELSEAVQMSPDLIGARATLVSLQ